MSIANIDCVSLNTNIQISFYGKMTDIGNNYNLNLLIPNWIECIRKYGTPN